MLMKKELLKLLVISMMIPLMGACSNSNKDSSVPEEELSGDPIVPLDRLLDAPMWATPHEQLTSYNDEAYYRSEFENNVKSDYSFNIELNDDAPTGITGLDSYIEIMDNTKVKSSLSIETLTNRIYEVSPAIPYEQGRYYTVTLKDNAPFHIYKKDPAIKEFHFNVERENTEIYQVSNEVKRFPLSDVTYKDDLSNCQPGETHTLRCKNALNLQEGDTFLFTNETIDRHSFYGKFQREYKANNEYVVSYTDPDLENIFGENGLDIYYQSYVPDEIYDLVLCSEKSIRDDIIKSGEMSRMFYSAYSSYEPEEEHLEMDAQGWIEAMKNIRIQPKFGFNWPGWSFYLTVKLTVPFKYASLTFMFQYYRKSVITMDGGVKLRKCLGIPYWADIAVDISETLDQSFRFTVAVGDKLPAIGGDDDTDFNHLSTYVMENASKFEGADKKMKSIADSKKDGVNFDGKSLTIELGTGRFPFGVIFDVFIDFDLVIKVEAEIMLGYTYTEHSTNTIVSYRSDSDEKSSHSVAELSSSTKSISLIGTIGVDAGIHFRFGVGVCGLEDYISLAIYADIGLYFQIGGYGTWSWTTEGGKTTYNGMGGFLFEVGWYAGVGVKLSLFFVDISVDFITVRKPFYTTTDDEYFLNRPNIEGDINLEAPTTNVANLHLLVIEHFETISMSIGYSEYDPEVIKTYTNDSGDKVTGRIFNFSFKDGRYIKYENGNLVVKDGAPHKFDDVMYVDVPKALYELKDGENHFIEVAIHYFDANAREVTFDGVTEGVHLIGDQITIPGQPEYREGYRFYGWKEVKTGDIYAEGETYTIPTATVMHEQVEFVSIYIEIIYHTVNFYDGLGNLIVAKRVEEGTDATEPSAEARDALMPADAIFVGWSTEFTNVYYDIDVYAIYIYVDEGGH